MADFMSSLFGTKQKVDPYGTLNPEQRALNQSLGPELTKSATAPASNNLYTGNLTAPITSGEQTVVDNAARANVTANNTYGTLGTYDPATFNKQFDEEVANPTFESYKRNVLPGIQEAVPGFSTARANITARGLQNTSDQLLQARNAARTTAQQTALNALQGQSNYNVNAANIAAIPRVIQQAGLDAQYKNFIQANQQKQDSINQALNFLGISTGTVTQQNSGLMDLLAAGKSAAQIYSAFATGGASSIGNNGLGVSSGTPNYSLKTSPLLQ